MPSRTKERVNHANPDTADHEGDGNAAPDQYTAYAPAALRDRMPHIETIDGKSMWVVDGKPRNSVGAVTVRKDGEKLYGIEV